MFALMEEVRVLVGRLEPHDTGNIHDTISVLNDRVEEIRYSLSKDGNTLELFSEHLNTKRADPMKEGTD